MPLQDPQVLQTNCALAFNSLANLYQQAEKPVERDACLTKAKALLDKAYTSLITL